MPGRFLSQAEREQISRFSSSISENDLIVYFTLTLADLELIQKQREAHNRYRWLYGLSVCLIRPIGAAVFATIARDRRTQSLLY
jgi:hypothetical protein